MNFTVIEETQLASLFGKIDTVLQEAKMLSDENYILKTRYLTAKQVGEITGYGEKTIKNRKDEIGYITKGGELKFLMENVNEWMMKDYVKPRKMRVAS